MTAFWCEQAVLSGEVRRRVRIVSAGGAIVSVEQDAASAAGDVLLRGVVLPGIANAHSHAFHRALRGTTHADGGTFWNWRTAMYALAARLEPESYGRLATAVFAEMVLAGFTAVGEFHYVHTRRDGTPYEDADMERALLAAAEAAGIRITLLDTLYLRGGLDSCGSSMPLAPHQRRFSDGSVAAWAERRSRIPGSPTALVGAAVHSTRAVGAGDLAEFRAATAGTKAVHAHVSEQPAENEQVRAATGRTPTQVLAAAGLVDSAFTAVHATHLDDHDIATLGDARATACFCPTTERDLADGIGPARRIVDAGAALAIGTDQHAVVDPFEEVRGVEMNERLASGYRGRFAPRELLTAATADGYRSLGWTGGEIEPGALCDLVAIDLGSVRTAGSSADQVWLTATSSDVTDVIVHGSVIVRDGRHRLGDVGALLGEAVDALRR